MDSFVIAADPVAARQKFDIAVLGGGPGGYVAAIRAAQMGKKTCLIEKDKVGGVCLNRGCIPTKTLLRSLEVLHEVKESYQYGVTGVNVDSVRFDMTAVQKRKNKVVKGLVSGVDNLLKSNGVTVFHHECNFVDNHTIAVNDQVITAENIIIATGSASKTLNIPISPAAKVLTSTEALELVDLPSSMAIIGGGVIGIEFAYLFANLGVSVTVIEFMNTILPTIDEEISVGVLKELKAVGVEFYLNTRVSEIKESSIVFEKDGQTFTVQCEQVLMSVGRAPNIEGLDFDRLGIALEGGAVVTDEYMRTNIPNIYAIGDVNGKAMLAHVASMEGVVAVGNICGDNILMDYSKIPSCIYLQPEIACIGLTETQAREKYGDIKVGKFPMQASGKAKVAGNAKGFIKVIVEPLYNEIVGAHLYCINATDMIAELAVAMKLESTADDMIYAVHPHPTVSEVIHEAFHAALHRAIHSI